MEIYKYFKKKEYKEDFLNGKIRLSSLSYYRALENAQQGDRVEGLNQYHLEDYTITKDISEEINSKNPSVSGLIHIADDDSKLHFSDMSLKISHPDAYILCATTLRNDDFFRKEFGEYIIQIKSIQTLSRCIGKTLSSQIRSEIGAKHQAVGYTKRIHKDLRDFDDAAFTKPEFPYAPQNEYRFAWLPRPFKRDLQTLTIEISKDRANKHFIDIK